MGCTSLSLIGTLSLRGTLNSIETYTLDLRFAALKKRPASTNIVVLLERKHQGRARYAELIRYYKDVAAIGFDLIFEGPDRFGPLNDIILEKFTAEANVERNRVHYAFGRGDSVCISGLERSAWKLEGIPKGRLYTLDAVAVPLPALLQHAQAGHVYIGPDEQIVRRVPLIVERQGEYYPLLGLRIACDFLGVDIESIEIKLGSHIKLRPARGEDIYIPIDSKARMLVNYAGGFDEEKGIFEGFNGKYLPEDIRALPDSLPILDDPSGAKCQHSGVTYVAVAMSHLYSPPLTQFLFSGGFSPLKTGKKVSR